MSSIGSVEVYACALVHTDVFKTNVIASMAGCFGCFGAGSPSNKMHGVANLINFADVALVQNRPVANIEKHRRTALEKTGCIIIAIAFVCHIAS